MKASLLSRVCLASSLILILESSTIQPSAWATPVTGPSRLSRGSSETQRISIPEAQAYEEIQRLFSQGQFDETLKKAAFFTAQYPSSSLGSEIENMRGVIALKKQKISDAIHFFQSALSDSQSTPAFQHAVRYNLASAYFENNALAEAESLLQKIQPESLDPSTQLKLMVLRANLLDRKGQGEEAISLILSSTLRNEEEELLPLKKSLYRPLLHSLEQISRLSTLEKLLTDYEGSPLSDAILFRIGSYHFNLNHYGQAETSFNLLLKQYPESSFKEQINQILSQERDDSKTRPRVIGVLLPLKGKFAKYAQRSLQGIELALDLFNPSEPDSQLKLVIEDAGEEPESHIQALNRLAFKHRVSVVIGPMMSKGAEQVYQRAEEIGIPLISLSRKSPQNLEYVFGAGLTNSLLAYEAARHAITHLGFKRLAILAPQDKFGQEMTQAFWSATEALGGEIVGFETYQPTDTDFRAQVDRLAGLHYTNSRKKELDALAKERELNQITKRTRKTEKFFQLPPVVDFDAVFIPDEAKISGQMIPTFAYRDVENIKFIGTSAWNSPEFINRTLNTGDHSYFVDVFLSRSSPDQKNAGYTRQYSDQYQQDATSIDAIAYDAALLLKSVLGTSGTLSRKQIKDTLKKISSFQGATGTLRYEEGKFYRPLKLISIQGGQLKVVD